VPVTANRACPEAFKVSRKSSPLSSLRLSVMGTVCQNVGAILVVARGRPQGPPLHHRRGFRPPLVVFELASWTTRRVPSFFGSDPSPGLLRLMKPPAAVHPLPKGEGLDFGSLRVRR
jgi:hypothetical protein